MNIKRLIVVVGLSLLTGCADSDIGSALTAVGFYDEVKPPVAVDILCDPSEGSPCMEHTLSATLDVVLPFVAERPRSFVRLWTMGATLGQTQLQGSRTVDHASKNTTRARRAYAERFVDASREYFLKGSEVIYQSGAVDRSPLAESLSKVALARANHEIQRILIVISDAREVSVQLGDFECGPLPEPEAFMRHLQQQQILAPGSLDHARVVFTYVSLAEIPNGRCPVTMARSIRIQSLWEAALSRAGASQVAFRSDVVALSDLTGKEEPAS